MKVIKMSDARLVNEARRLVKEERVVLVSLLTLLREIERRKIFSDYKCSSLFDFSVRVLGYSESQAQRRILAMRLIRDNPETEAKLRNGSLSLTNAANAQALFQRVKRDLPRREILAKLEHKSSREAELIFAEIAPNPHAKLREGVRRIGNGEVELRVVLKEETLEKLERIRGLLVHKKGALRHADLIDFLAEEGLEKFMPKNPKTNANTLAAPKVKTVRLRKRIPANVRRKIWHEAKGKCTNCQSVFALENDHIEAVALGGGNDLGNLRLLCRNCNQRAAISLFGVRKVGKHNQRGSLSSSPRTAAST